MTSLESALVGLDHAVADLRRTNFQSANSQLAILVADLDADPIRSLLQSFLPEFELEPWLAASGAPAGHLRGTDQLAWPKDFRERVACRVALCRFAAADRGRFKDIMHRFVGLSGNLQERVQQFADVIVEPLVRDIRRLSTLRQPPPVLESLLIRKLAESGDDRLDELLREAIDKFTSANPVVRREGLERLWDAWERLKTIVDPANKKASAEALLARAAPESRFQQVLEEEAGSLNKIGNDFQIRHFEKGKVPLTGDAQVDYLFHRMFALIWFLLTSLRASALQGAA